MSAVRNPVIAELAEKLSWPEVRMLNALEAAYLLLDREADNLYEAGAEAQAIELSVFAEDIVGRIEEIAEEVLGERDEPEGSELELSGRETEQSSLEADLADAYHDWIVFSSGDVPMRHFESREEFIELLRHIAHYHPSLGRPLDPAVTDEQLLDAARDSYEEYRRRWKVTGRTPR